MSAPAESVPCILSCSSAPLFTTLTLQCHILHIFTVSVEGGVTGGVNSTLLPSGAVRNSEWCWMEDLESLLHSHIPGEIRMCM